MYIHVYVKHYCNSVYKHFDIDYEVLSVYFYRGRNIIVLLSRSLNKGAFKTNPTLPCVRSFIILLGTYTVI